MSVNAGGFDAFSTFTGVGGSNYSAPLTDSNLFTSGLFGSGASSFNPTVQGSTESAIASTPVSSQSLPALPPLSSLTGSLTGNGTGSSFDPSGLQNVSLLGGNIGNAITGSGVAGSALGSFLGGPIVNIASVIIGVLFVGAGVYGIVK
jgi:hypothetical protein